MRELGTMRTPVGLTLAFLTLTCVAQAQTTSDVTFETETLVIPADNGPIEIEVEIADTPERRSRGYMERTDIGPDDGMLFVFGMSREISMWMKNTPTSLDMLFVCGDGTIRTIARDTVPQSTDIVPSNGPVPYVLEVVAGSSDRWGLEPGDKLQSPRFSDQAEGCEAAPA